MHRYILRKLALMIPSVFAVVTIVFVVIRIAGGDPARAILGDDADMDVIQAFREKYGLDAPMPVQYINYLAGLLRGDLGISFSTSQPVLDSYMAMLPSTVELIIGAVFFMVIIGIPLGLLAAIQHDRMADHITALFSTVLLGFPVFFLGIVLLVVFGANLGWFPVLGAGEPGDVGDRIHHLILPALALGLVEGSRVLRVTRTSILSVLRQDYVRTARAKGLSEPAVILGHALRNALIPVVILIGLQIAHLLAGAILTETVFNRPGIGRLLVGAIRARDYPLVQSGLLIYGVMVVLVNLVADLSITFIDPKVKYE